MFQVPGFGRSQPAAEGAQQRHRMHAARVSGGGLEPGVDRFWQARGVVLNCCGHNFSVNVNVSVSVNVEMPTSREQDQMACLVCFRFDGGIDRMFPGSAWLQWQRQWESSVGRRRQVQPGGVRWGSLKVVPRPAGFPPCSIQSSRPTTAHHRNRLQYRILATANACTLSFISPLRRFDAPEVLGLRNGWLLSDTFSVEHNQQHCQIGPRHDRNAREWTYIARSSAPCQHKERLWSFAPENKLGQQELAREHTSGFPPYALGDDIHDVLQLE